MPAWTRRALAYSWPIRVALGLMFLVSSASALGDLSAFVAEVRSYGLLPEPLPIPFGYALPFVELLLGIMLVAGLFTRLAATGSGILMIAFMVAIAYRLLTSGEAADCGCFSLLGKEQLSWLTFGRDVVFLVAIGIVLLDRALWVSVDRYLFGWGEDLDEVGSAVDSEEGPATSPST